MNLVHNQKITRLVRVWSGPVILAALFAFLAAAGWRKWPDILIDFGHELYIPWQLLSGRVLYADIAHLYGPFSQYANALLFGCFGVSFTTIFAANLVLAAGLSAVMYTVFTNMFDRCAAFGCGAVMLTVFIFSQLGSTGNYNFVCPYSHEATHGLMLSALLMLLLRRWGTERRNRWLALSGAVLACVLMTRAEVAVAAVLYAACFLWLTVRGDFQSGGRIGPVLFFSAGFAVPPIVFFIMFKQAMSAADALRAVGAAWTSLLDGSVMANSFFIAGLGFDHPLANAVGMALGAGAAAGILLLVVWLLRFSDRGTSLFRGIVPFALPALAAGGVSRLNPYHAARPLPLFVLAIMAAAVVVYRKTSPRRYRDRGPLTFFISFTVFSAGLLLKMIMNCRLYHYGFYLAGPAVLICVLFLFWFVPRFILRSRRNRRVFKITALAAALVFGGLYMLESLEIYRLRTYPVGSGADRIVTFGPRYDARGRIIRQALGWIETGMEQEAGFVALPEGVMLNYLSRRAGPSRYTTYMMTEMLAFGEAAMLADIQADPPDYILIVHKDTGEFGVGFFGSDTTYGMKIMDWIEQRYETVALFGREPLKNSYFGIKILRLKSAPPAK